MAQHSATSGFIREAISESRSFVKEIVRTKHAPITKELTTAKSHLYAI